MDQHRNKTVQDVSPSHVNDTILLLKQLNFHINQHINDSFLPNSVMNNGVASIPDLAKVTITAVIVFGFPVLVLAAICILRFRISRLRRHNGYFIDRKSDHTSSSTYIPMAITDHHSGTALLKAPHTLQNLEMRRKSVRSDNPSDSDKTRDTTIEDPPNSSLMSPGYDCFILRRDSEDITHLSSYVVDYEVNGESLTDSEKINE